MIKTNQVNLHPLWAERDLAIQNWLDSQTNTNWRGNIPGLHFQNCPTIKSAFSTEFEGIEYMFGFLNCQEDFPTWNSALPDSPFACYKPSKLALYTTDNIIFQAFCAVAIKNSLGFEYDRVKSIFEFGASFGDMWYLLQSAGFYSHEKYYTTLEIESINSILMERADFDATGPTNILTEINWDNLADSPHPRGRQGEDNYIIELPPEKRPRWDETLYLSINGLSEVPVAARANYLSVNPKYFAFVYTDRFEEIDNKSYFANLQYTKTNYQWKYLVANNLNFCLGKLIS